MSDSKDIWLTMTNLKIKAENYIFFSLQMSVEMYKGITSQGFLGSLRVLNIIYKHVNSRGVKGSFRNSPLGGSSTARLRRSDMRLSDRQLLCHAMGHNFAIFHGKCLQKKCSTNVNCPTWEHRIAATSAASTHYPIWQKTILAYTCKVFLSVIDITF